MEHVGGFFQKYLIGGIRRMKVKEICQEAIRQSTGILVDLGDLDVKKGRLTVSGRASLKHQLFLHQQAIIGELGKFPETQIITELA